MNLSQEYFHPKTLTLLDQYIVNPFHALLLVGAEGVGKQFAVDYIVQSLSKKTSDQYSHTILLQNSGIEDIRKLRQDLSSSFVPAEKSPFRIVIIRNFDTMSREVHAALLKVIEEPPAYTLFVCTIDKLAGVPETIRSRSVSIDVLPLSQARLQSVLKSKGLPDGDITKIWHQYNGRIAASLDAIVGSDNISELAKKFVSSKQLDRIIMINEITSLERQNQKQLLQTIGSIVKYQIQSAKTVEEHCRFVKILTAIDLSEIHINAQANAKLTWLQLSYEL